MQPALILIDIRNDYFACATRALAFGDERVPATQVRAAFVAALSGLCAKVQNAAAIAAEIAG
jgi:hypothetical protein